MFSVCISVCVCGTRVEGRKFRNCELVENWLRKEENRDREREREKEREKVVCVYNYDEKCMHERMGKRERERENRNLARITMCVLYKIYSLQLFVMDTFYLSNKS